jgi:tetratricopeptide (TPR) repeat protein
MVCAPLHYMRSFTRLTSMKSSWTAWNVEPDDNPEDDVDNTREIQLEEAFKLYQNALKLHAQGPQYYEQAGEAYDLLFKSEVFTYPESLIDLADPTEGLELDYTLDALSAGASNDSPSTLPQILYLAYKNHGQFIMDCLKHQIRSGKLKSSSELLPKARLALEQFTQAIARDESDTELWRRAARIGAFVGSSAIARYCLESAVEVDDDPTLGEVDPANLEEGFAGIQLKEHLEVLSDTVALSHPIMLPYMTKAPSERLRKYMDPYPFLPELPGDQTRKDESSGDAKNRLVIELRDRSWEALAEGLLQLSESNDESSARITIHIPDAYEDAEMVDAVVSDQPLPEPSRSSSEIPTPTDEPIPPQKEEANPPSEIVPEPVDAPVEQESPSTTRKRSHSAAGMQEPTEEDAGMQKRSKRIRNRESTLVAESTPLDPNAQFKEQLDELSQGDKWMFAFAGSKLEKFGVTELGQFDDLQAVVTVEAASEKQDNMGSNTVIKDLQDILSNWDDAKADAYLSGNGMDILGVSGRGAQAGLAAFLEHSKPDSQKLATQLSRDEPMGLLSLVKTINNDWRPLQDVAYLFFKAFRPNYRSCLWSESLKLKLIQLMTRFDSAVYDRLRSEYERFPTQESDLSNVEALEQFAQMMFELHLDVYASITNPSSAVGYGVRTGQNDSLNRWAHLASDIVQSRPRKVDDELTFRYLWASVLLASMAEGTSQEHIVLCWTDLQAFLQQCGDPKIEIQNNAAMSEISASAADREISRLTTMDFFLSLFKADKLDKGDKTESLNIIEALEPVLDPSSCEIAGSKSSDVVNEEGGNLNLLEADNAVIPPMLRDMRKFLDRGSTSLRLFLWQRLREAYEHIKYTTKVFSCYLKSIEIIVSDLHSPAYAEAPAAARQQQLLTQLKALDDLLVKALTLALNDQTAFDIVDDTHIKSSMKAVARLARMLHSTALFEDKIRVGMTSVPRSAEKASFRFNSFLVRMAEMQIRTWALLYTLLKEGMSQNKDIFTTIDNDLADYLAVVHYPLGLRKCCRYSNKIFLKMMKVEMLRFKHVEKWEDYLGQVLYDLYGIRLGVGVFELMEHGCEIESLDRRTAMTLSDQVITLANRMSMKDLLKSELRPTIEKMQQAIGANRATPQMMHNLRNINDYLKRTLNPRYLAQAWKGQVRIDTVRVISPESPIAEKEWYFLLGMIHLTKFRSQKRIAAGATDDLKVASSFFRLQLQFTPDHWESWYRFAQCCDAELEEEILWSADKLNMERAPLNQLQKHSIHSYTMAVSTAMRNADASFETASRMSSMFHNFGFRIYATSRDPFNMEPFHQDENAKFFSGNQGMYTRPPHAELTRVKAWKFAAGLFRRSLVEQPDSWM